MLYAGVLARSLEDSFGLRNPDEPALYGLSGTRLGQVPYRGGVLMIQAADALLYIVPREAFTQASPLAGSLDPAYMKEVDRRSIIEWGELRARRFLGAAAH